MTSDINISVVAIPHFPQKHPPLMKKQKHKKL